jgi:RNA polymerase sigma-70 factor (ECF subfamily)
MDQMHPDEAAAIAQARHGDHDAFRLLVERHSRSMYRLAYRMTGRAEDAEDIVQETFVRAFRQIGRFEQRSDFGTWLYRIAFNCAIDYLRARPRHESAEPEDTLDRLAPANATPSLDDLIYAGQIERRVQTALSGLSAKERAAFLLRHYHGCSIDEICRTLDMKSNAAKHSVFRAVRKLRVALAPLMDRRLESVASAQDES